MGAIVEFDCRPSNSWGNLLLGLSRQRRRRWRRRVAGGGGGGGDEQNNKYTSINAKWPCRQSHTTSACVYLYLHLSMCVCVRMTACLCMRVCVCLWAPQKWKQILAWLLIVCLFHCLVGVLGMSRRPIVGLVLPTHAHIYCFPIGNKNGGRKPLSQPGRQASTAKLRRARSWEVEVKLKWKAKQRYSDKTIKAAHAHRHTQTQAGKTSWSFSDFDLLDAVFCQPFTAPLCRHSPTPCCVPLRLCCKHSPLPPLIKTNTMRP